MLINQDPKVKASALAQIRKKANEKFGEEKGTYLTEELEQAIESENKDVLQDVLDTILR